MRLVVDRSFDYAQDDETEGAQVEAGVLRAVAVNFLVASSVKCAPTTDHRLPTTISPQPAP